VVQVLVLDQKMDYGSPYGIVGYSIELRPGIKDHAFLVFNRLVKDNEFVHCFLLRVKIIYSYPHF